MKDAIKEEQKLHVTNYGGVNSLFDTYNAESNFITSEGHFHIMFANGYEVSLFNGLGSYTDNLRIENEKNVFSKYMEVSIIKDGHFVTRDFITGINDDVVGLLKPETVVEILMKVKDYER